MFETQFSLIAVYTRKILTELTYIPLNAQGIKIL